MRYELFPIISFSCLRLFALATDYLWLLWTITTKSNLLRSLLQSAAHVGIKPLIDEITRHGLLYGYRSLITVITEGLEVPMFDLHDYRNHHPNLKVTKTLKRYYSV